MRNLLNLTAVLSVLVLLTMPLWAESPASAPAGKEVVAKVGDAEITAAEVDGVLNGLKGLPPEKRAAVRGKVVDMMIAQNVVRQFVQKEKVTCTPEETADFCKRQFGAEAADAGVSVDQLIKDRGISKDSINSQVCLEKIMKGASSDAKATDLVKKNPDYFNGTQVRASHILITCSPFAPTEIQQAAVKKLETLTADIKAGKISFEDAAKKESSCPSKEKGGDLDFFTYERMVPSFATAAFATKKGEMTGIVRSNFGFHLIKVTDRKAGTDKPGENANEVARRVLQGQVEDRLMNMALTDGKIVVK